MFSPVGTLLILALINVNVILVEAGRPKPEENEIRKGLQGHNGNWRNFATDIDRNKMK